MSGYIPLSPAPPRLGARAPGDTDPVVLDWTAMLAPVSDTLASITAVTVSRSDGVTPGVGDLTVTGSAVVNATQMKVSLGAGIAGVDYVLTATVVTAGGLILTRAAMQLVVADLG